MHKIMEHTPASHYAYLWVRKGCVTWEQEQRELELSVIFHFLEKDMKQIQRMLLLVHDG